VAAVYASHPDVKVIETGANLGYAGGNNVGISLALDQGAEYVLILNNDATIEAEAISCAVSVAQSLSPATGVVGFATYRYEAPEVLHCLGLNAGAHRGFYVPTKQQMMESEVLPIGSAHGCAMLLTRKLLETVGLLDEEFFLMHEELDLCQRARRAGFDVVGATNARVLHKGAVSFGGETSPLKLFYLYRNWPLYVWKRFSERNETHLFENYLSRFRKAARAEAVQFLRESKLTHMFAVLAAGRCVEERRWGKKQFPLRLRLLVYWEMFRILVQSLILKIRLGLGLLVS